MPYTWQEDASDTWTLRDTEGGVLAAITKHGPAGGQAEPVFRISGVPAGEVRDFPTYEEAQQALLELLGDSDA